MSDVLVRLEVLRRMIDRGSEALPWCGNTAIQKLVYVLQHIYKIDLGYKFGLHHYGPFSHDLGNSVSLGEQSGFWKTTAYYIGGRTGAGVAREFEVSDNMELPESVQTQADEVWEPLEPKLTAADSGKSGHCGA